MKKQCAYPYYEHKRLYTLKELVRFCAETYGEKPAFLFRERKAPVAISYLRFREDVCALGSWMLQAFGPDAHVGILGENSYAWILTHFAVTCGGGVAVPIDKDLDTEEITRLLKDSGCEVLFHSNTYADVAASLRQALPQLRLQNMKTIQDLIASGDAAFAGGSQAFFQRELSPDSLASVVYTSGTTGMPKGVMLTHSNLCACMYGSASNVTIAGTSLLVLPLHHAFGLTAGVFSVMYTGFPIYINRSLKRLTEDFRVCTPDNLFAVPLIVETFHKNIWASARKQNKEKQLKALIKVSDLLRKLGIDLRKRLFRSVLEAFGGSLSLIVSGGAALDEKYVQDFRSLGITVLNGYGITECGPVVAVNRNKFVVPESVGLPLRCNQVRISADGELQVTGDNVTPGYYHNETESEKAFTKDGWFRTGDLGFLDKDGALHITGRIKNLIILSNGENIPAEAIEREIFTIPYVKEAVAFGKNGHIAVEAFLDEDAQKTKDDFDADIQMLNMRLPQNRNIGETILRDTPFTKTTTQKIKRQEELKRT